LANKLSLGHLVIQTVEDSFFAVFPAVINSCTEGTNFVKRLKNKNDCLRKKMVIRGQKEYVESSGM